MASIDVPEKVYLPIFEAELKNILTKSIKFFKSRDSIYRQNIDSKIIKHSWSEILIKLKR